MIVALDHIMVVVEEGHLERLATRLKSAGFVHGDAGRHVDLGTANENLAYKGGGYVELIYEDPPGGSELTWFDHGSRVLGLVFSSTEFAADIAPWQEMEGAWNQTVNKVLEDGTRVQLRAASPFERGDFDLIVIDRDAPPFRDKDASAALKTLTFVGQDHSVWNERLQTYMGLGPSANGGLRAGDVEIRFEPGPTERCHVTAGFEVAQEAGRVPLGDGALDLVAARG